MKRDLTALGRDTFDVVIVGGGIHGATIARDAALRGLRVALVEKGDFGGATSHNSLKIIHGGIRYLQHLNLRRTVASIRETQILLATAPHLLCPLPVLMPAYGYGMRGPFALGAAIILYEMLYRMVALWDGRRARGPRIRVMGKKACLNRAPGIDQVGLTGGAIWTDAQITYADRAVLQILAHAADHGAVVANHMEATGLLSAEAGRIGGINAVDRHTGNTLKINARAVINAAGPWVGEWTRAPEMPLTSAQIGLVRSMNIVTNKPAPATAMAVKSNRASDSRIDTANRMFFVVPWQGKAVIGTTHFTHKGGGLNISPNAAEVRQFIDEYNAADSATQLTSEDVLYCYIGLTPSDDTAEADGATQHESLILDHGKTEGCVGVFSIIGTKWTTARGVAEEAVDRLMAHLGETGACKTRTAPLPDQPAEPGSLHKMTDDQLRAFAIAQINETQAAQLDDLLLRRTDDLVLGHLKAEQILIILDTMAGRLDWTPERTQAELDRVLSRLHPSSYQKSLCAALRGMTDDH